MDCHKGGTGFESQTKTKLGSTDMGGDLPTVRTFINDFIKATG
jgi:topoisomerase-4 subunit B